MPEGSTLYLPVPAGFDLPRVVCSYGYFTLAPNRWDAYRQTLTRPLRDTRGRSVTVDVRQTRARPDRLRVDCEQRLARADQTCVRQQIRRMLRLDEDLSGWFARSPEARREGFGRLFRSPTLFEDIVKTITGCNTAWSNTMRMNRLLCEKIGGGDFPTAAELARVPPAGLKTKTKVGYRAQRIHQLAIACNEGAIDLAWFEQPERTSDEAFAALRRIHGLGPYAAANICQHLGFYDKLAIDSETYRHFCEHFDVQRPDDPKALDARIEAHYDQYAPYQFLAYWHELWANYERKVGDARLWDTATGARITKADRSNEE